MIGIVSGDLFASDAQTLINATNVEGIMGGGIALAFRECFPQMYVAYAEACRLNIHTVKRPYLWRPGRYAEAGDKWVLNIATKNLVKNESDYLWVGWGCKWLAENYDAEGITSVAMPALGCGLGGLEWARVKDVIFRELEHIALPVYLYQPHEQ